MMAKCLQKDTFSRKSTGLFRRLRSETRGQELVEFAFLMLYILPPLLIGTIWIGRGFTVYQALGRAAREGARVALAPTCASCGDTAADDPTVDAAISQHLIASGVNPANLVSPPSITRYAAAQDTTDPSNYQVPWVTVTLTYPVQSMFLNFNWTAFTFNVTTSVTMYKEF